MTALPSLTEATGATFKAAFATKVDPDEAAERGLTDLGVEGGAGGEDGWKVVNDWGTWIQRLDFYYIPADGELHTSSFTSTRTAVCFQILRCEDRTKLSNMATPDRITSYPALNLLQASPWSTRMKTRISIST